MQKFKLTRLAAYLALAAGLAACNANGNGSNTNTNTNTGGGGPGSPLILDETQKNLSNLVTGLGNTIGTDNNLGAFVVCLDPTVNDLVDGPDALLTNLLGSINSSLGTQDPAAVQAALTASGDSLAAGLTSLTVNLPNALMALADPAAASNCGTTGGSTGGSTGGATGTPLDTLIGLLTSGTNPFAGTPLEALGTVGAPGTPTGGPTGTPLDALLAPLQAIAAGDNSSQIVDQLGQGVALLGSSLQANIPDQVVTAPVVGGVITLLGDTLNDLGTVLDQLEQPTTAGQLEGTLNNLLSNLTGTLVGLDPSGQLSTTAGPQIQAGINQLTSTLGDALLQPVAGTGGLVPTLTEALAPLTCALNLVGACTSTGGSTPSASDIPLLGDLLAAAPTSGSTTSGPISGALAGTPLSAIGGLLATLGL